MAHSESEPSLDVQCVGRFPYALLVKDRFLRVTILNVGVFCWFSYFSSYALLCKT
jgi:hypothetical protein